MSRSGYVDDFDGDLDELWAFIRYRGAVKSAIRGKRGQAFLKEMLAALDALPKPELIAEELERDGAVCAIGAVGRARNVNMSGVSPEDSEQVAAMFGISESLAREIVFHNDEGLGRTPWSRFEYMRRWIVENLTDAETALMQRDMNR